MPYAMESDRPLDLRGNATDTQGTTTSFHTPSDSTLSSWHATIIATQPYNTTYQITAHISQAKDMI